MFRLSGLCLSCCLLSSAILQAQEPTAPPPATPEPRPVVSVFAYPTGLSAPPEVLFERLGFISGVGVPLTRETIFEIAYKCFITERYTDALVMATHGIAQTGDARLWLMKGACELQLGRNADAEKSVTEYRYAVTAGRQFGLYTARERIGGPMRARFELILVHQLEAAAPPPAPLSPPADGV